MLLVTTGETAGYLHRRAAADAVGGDHRGQKLPAVGLVEKAHRERGRGGRIDRADRAVVEDDRVVAGRRIEAVAVDDDRGRHWRPVGTKDWRRRPALSRPPATPVPLLAPLAVTEAVRLPTASGSVMNETVSEVAVAAVIAPTAPSLNATVSCDDVALKP